MLSEANRKCCADCAFRVGSPERSDPYAWMQHVEAWTTGSKFVCHKSAPGHRLEVQDGSPRNRICAGWAATHDLPASVLMRLAAHPTYAKIALVAAGRAAITPDQGERDGHG